MAIVAPFFADADTRGPKTGVIYYRQTNDHFLLERVEQDVRYRFQHASFKPTLLYVVTWDKMGYYNRQDDKVSLISYVLTLILLFIMTQL